MNPGGRYRVIGRLAFSGYEPGQVFTTVLDPGVERRAMLRGNIQLLERVNPTLPDGYKLPAERSTSEREVCKT